MIKTIATTKNITVQVPDDALDILCTKNRDFKSLFSHRTRGSTWRTNIPRDSPAPLLLDRKDPSMALLR